MKTSIAKLLCFPFLMACMMNAFATTGNMPVSGPDVAETRQTERRLHWLGASLAQHDGSDQFARDGERRGRRGEGRPERFQEDRNRYGNEQAGSFPDEGRRGARMSPEERRALRQQINEAGRDIYGSRR